MIKTLKIQNVGPAPEMTLDFGKRLNILTGDNGLGKSFLEDIIWWALTRRWPADLNPRLTTGKMAVPPLGKEGRISYSYSGKSKPMKNDSKFIREIQAWDNKQGRPANPGLVLYAMSDGSFAVWDPHRNYWKSRKGMEADIFYERPAAYVFSQSEVWNGLQGENGWLCNGLLRDWASWQKENGEPFVQLQNVLKVLSPSEDEMIKPGRLTRVGLDSRDIPTLQMPYGEVPVIHASAGMRRVMALAYLLVWAWEEHKQAAIQLETENTNQITFLVDEIEAHLHPKWQRVIVPSLLSVMEQLSPNAHVQLITATHSPLVMASIEPVFDDKKDAWFDLDLVAGEVKLEKQPFIKMGDASTWLMSNAFDLKTALSVQAEKVLREASDALQNPDFTVGDAQKLDAELRKVLGELDPFWITWRYTGKKKGWFA